MHGQYIRVYRGMHSVLTILPDIAMRYLLLFFIFQPNRGSSQVSLFSPIRAKYSRLRLLLQANALPPWTLRQRCLVNPHDIARPGFKTVIVPKLTKPYAQP